MKRPRGPLDHATLMRRRAQALAAYVALNRAHELASKRHHRTLLALATCTSPAAHELLAWRRIERTQASEAFHRACTRLYRQEHPIAAEDEARAVRRRAASLRRP